MVAVSAIHSYYTLTMVSSTEPNVGENGTGVKGGPTICTGAWK